MKLSSLHLLLTYQCTYECDHCFVWGGPHQSGTMTWNDLQMILEQAKGLGTIQSIYFEGGEPFLYYPLLLKSVREAVEEGFQVGIVTNGYWATSLEDALIWLGPFMGLLQDLTISSDCYHADEKISRQAQTATWAAQKLGIPISLITIAQPEDLDANSTQGQITPGDSSIMYRGRAAIKLVSRAALHPWEQFTECPFEDLRNPARVHLDPFGYVHICQGISIGNIFAHSLHEILTAYQPDSHPITGPLLRGGPVELSRRYGIAPAAEGYADACHFCYTTRLALRAQSESMFENLAPGAVYGEITG